MTRNNHPHQGPKLIIGKLAIGVVFNHVNDDRPSEVSVTVGTRSNPVDAEGVRVRVEEGPQVRMWYLDDQGISLVLVGFRFMPTC